jgi:hypothetical protein
MIATPAFANAGIGYFFLVLPMMVVALVAVIPAEGLVLSAMLRVPLASGMRLSLRANLRSTLWGLAIGIAFDMALIGLTGAAGPEPTRSAASWMLLPMFGLSWWIEHRSVVRNAKESGVMPIAAATGAANALSYALMGAMVWLLYPAHDTQRSRVLISEGIAAATPVKTAVTEYWGKTRSFPADPRELKYGQPGAKYRIALEPAGRISIRFVEPDPPELVDKRVFLTPSADPEGLRWHCSAPELPSAYLPEACRPDR